MSHALSRLRGVFADELFVRAAAGMEPTARAREIAPLVSRQSGPTHLFLVGLIFERAGGPNSGSISD